MMMYGYVIGEEQLVKHVNPEGIHVDRKMHAADKDQIGGGVEQDHEGGMMVSPNGGINSIRTVSHRRARLMMILQCLR